MLRIREDGLTEEQQTPLELDNWQGSLFKGGDFPKMRLETWDKKKRKLVPTPEAVNRPLKTLTLVEREAPQKVEMPGGLSKEQLKELEKQKEKALEVFNQPVDDDDESSVSSTDSWFENRKDESTPANRKAKKFSSAIKKPKCSSSSSFVSMTTTTKITSRRTTTTTKATSKKSRAHGAGDGIDDDPDKRQRREWH